MFGSVIYFGIIFCLSGFVFIVVSSNNIDYIKNVSYVLIFKTICAVCIVCFCMLLLFILFLLSDFINKRYVIQMINNEKINVTNLLQIYCMMAAIIIYFMQMFFYCYVGELIIEQVSYNFIHV